MSLKLKFAKDKLLFENSYHNKFNYFNRNVIKMNKLKRKNFDDYINAKKRNKEELHLPKMLYSNFFINHPNLSIDNSEIREKVNNNISSEIIDYQVPYSNTRYEKDSIKEAIDKNKKEEKTQTHVGKQLK